MGVKYFLLPYQRFQTLWFYSFKKVSNLQFCNIDYSNKVYKIKNKQNLNQT